MTKKTNNAKGVDRDMAIAVCMVVGCGRKAIYRNARSAKTKGVQRGYCDVHKQMAVSTGSNSFYERRRPRSAPYESTVNMFVAEWKDE